MASRPVWVRDALARVKGHPGPGLPRAELAALTAAVPHGLALTIDFDAQALLGQPMLVLRARSRQPAPCFATLTAREREVAGLVATGLRNKDVALALGITVGTVKDHVHRILDKAGLDSRTAIAAQWSPPPGPG